MLDLIEMRKWADSEYDTLGATAYSRLSQMLTECDRLQRERQLEQAAVRRVAADLVVLAEA